MCAYVVHSFLFRENVGSTNKPSAVSPELSGMPLAVAVAVAFAVLDGVKLPSHYSLVELYNTLLFHFS